MKEEQILTPTFPSWAMLVCFVVMYLLCAAPIVRAQTSASNSGVAASADGQGQINPSAAEPASARLSGKELESLVGPIALYPDPLLFQTLAASTYPLEIIQLKQWLDKNKKLSGKTLVDTVAQQNWDSSVQALAAFPAVVDKLANNIQWTTDLGNAFLAQELEVMDSVQNLRAVAQANGVLKTDDKQKVGTEPTDDGKEAITIESAQREVVYIPTYNTKVVYRNSNYSDDSSYSGYYSNYSGYSQYSSGSSDNDYSYVAYAAGAATGYYWGYYNWRDRSGYTNGNNYYVKNYNNSGNSYRNIGNNNGNSSYRNIGNGNGNGSFRNIRNNNSANSFRNNANNGSQGLNQGSGRWQHDPSHRGGAPYGNSDLSQRFGQADSRLGNSRLGNQATQLGKTGEPRQAANLSRAGDGARLGPRAPNAGSANHIGNRMPSNFPGNGRAGAFSAPRGDVARAFSARGAQSMRPPAGFRGGPPSGLHAGGPPMGGGFRGGPPAGGFPGGGPPIGGGLPMGGGPPIGGAPPPPPPVP